MALTQCSQECATTGFGSLSVVHGAMGQLFDSSQKSELIRRQTLLQRPNLIHYGDDHTVPLPELRYQIQLEQMTGIA